MPSFRFSARKLPPLPATGQVDYWDESLPGFGMRVSAGGTRAWVVMYRYNGVKRRLKLGVHPGKGLADARDDAKAAFQAAEKGRDPATEKKTQKAKSDTVKDLAADYIENYAKAKKRSWFKDEKILNREVIPIIGRKRIEDVTRGDIRDVLKPIVARRAPVRANHTLEVVRKMFNWSLETRDVPAANPAARLSKPGESKTRSRFLKPAELPHFWAALSQENIGTTGADYFKLLLLNVQREMEVLRMRWADIDFDELLWTVPADHAKNELEHVIPITPLQAQILRARRSTATSRAVHVFPSPSPKRIGQPLARNFIEKRIRKIRAKSKIDDITPHDLRRTATTYFGKLNVPQLIKKKILNHAKRRKSDVTEIYDRYEYLDQKRDALTRWEELLLSMVGDCPLGSLAVDGLKSVKP
jgi:integrase